LYYIADGYTLLLSTYSFNCTASNFASCKDINAIMSTPPLVTSPVFCVPAQQSCIYNNITLLGFGAVAPTITTPEPAAAAKECSVISFEGDNITVDYAIIDGAHCSATLNTSGVNMTGSSINLTNVVFNAVHEGVGFQNTNIGTNVFTGVTATNPAPLHPGANAFIVANTASATGTITASAPSTYIVRTSGNVVVKNFVWDDWTRLSNLTCAQAQPPPPPPPPPATCTDTTNWTITIAVCVSVGGGVVLLVGFEMLKKHIQKPQAVATSAASTSR